MNERVDKCVTSERMPGHTVKRSPVLLASFLGKRAAAVVVLMLCHYQILTPSHKIQGTGDLHKEAIAMPCTGCHMEGLPQPLLWKSQLEIPAKCLQQVLAYFRATADGQLRKHPPSHTCM